MKKKFLMLILGIVVISLAGFFMTMGWRDTIFLKALVLPIGHASNEYDPYYFELSYNGNLTAYIGPKNYKDFQSTWDGDYDFISVEDATATHFFQEINAQSSRKLSSDEYRNIINKADELSRYQEVERIFDRASAGYIALLWYRDKMYQMHYELEESDSALLLRETINYLLAYSPLESSLNDLRFVHEE